MIDDPVAAELDREDLAAFIAAARAVDQPTGLDATLESILTEALRLLRADEGSVMLLTEKGSRLRIAASRGLPEDVADRVSVTVGEGISGAVAATGTPLLLDSSSDVERYADGHDRQRRLRSAVSVPLRSQGALRGVLNLSVTEGSSRPDFEAHDLQLATLFGEFAAAAVRDASLYARARRRTDDLGRLLEASHALSGALDVPDVGRHLLDAAADLVGAHAGVVYLAHRGQGVVDVSAVDGLALGWVRAVTRRSGFEQLLELSAPRLFTDVEHHPVLQPLGRLRPGAALVTPLRAGSDRTGLVVTIVDGDVVADDVLRRWITYTNQAAMALGRAALYREVRSKEEELTALVSATPDPLLVLDRQDRYLAINPAASQLFGLNPEFDLGRPADDRVRTGEIDDLLRQPGGGRGDVTLYTPAPRTFRARVTPVAPGMGPQGARILSLEDVTTEREMQQLKTDFTAVIGHELRTPLTMIKGYSTTLLRRGEALDGPYRQTALQALHNQSQRLERLIEDLLLVAGVERDRPPLHLEECDLREVVERGLGLAMDLHPGRTFDLEVPRHPVRLPVDAVKVHRVLQHLIDNAVKFSEPPEPVTVEIVPTDDGAEVRVVDRGIGIFSGDLPTLFERFHQLDGTATRERGGTGLGLHVCKTLIEAHGGRIGVRSALGRGSTFWFRLSEEPEIDAEHLAPVVHAPFGEGQAS